MIREQRWKSGKTQAALAQQVGVRAQQIQKYESGINRVPASRLWQIANVLGTTMSVFFVGLKAQSEEANAVPLQLAEEIEFAELSGKLSVEKREKLLALARAIVDGRT